MISAESNQQTVHGYIWSPSCHQYILHAKFPGELERSEMSNKRRRKTHGDKGEWKEEGEGNDKRKKDGGKVREGEGEEEKLGIG